MINKQMRKFSVFVLCLFLLFEFGCIQISEIDDQTIMYSTDIASNPQQYTMFINKEIEPITNHLVTQMGLADKVSSGEYPAEDAITSVQAAIKTVEESIKQVDMALPPADYMELRTNVLQAMVNVKDTLTAYESELLQPTLNKENIEKLRKVMEGDFSMLTGLFNVYHE